MLIVDAASARKQMPMSNQRWPAVTRRLHAFWHHFVPHSARGVALITICLFLAALYSATTDRIVVGPFSVPQEYEERGYTSEAVSNAVVQFIHGNESKVSFTQSAETSSTDGANVIDTLEDHIDGKHVISSFDPSTVPDIKVPMTSYSLEGLIELLRQTIGRPPVRVGGEIVALKDGDISGDTQVDPQKTRVLIRYKIEYPEPTRVLPGLYWWTRRTGAIAETLTANGAEEVIKKLALVTADGLARRTIPGQNDDKSRASRLRSRGNTYFGLGDYNRAARMFERANKLQPSGHAFLGLGVIAELKGDYQEAAGDYSQATQISNTDEDNDIDWALVYWGNLLLRQKNYRDAKSKYWLVTSGPAFHTERVRAAALTNIGFVDLIQHHPDSADEAFKKAEQLTLGLLDDCTKSACSADVNHEGDESESALTIDLGNQLLARIHYGQAQLNAGNTKSEYQKSIQAYPEYARSHYQLAQIYHSEHNYKKELDELQQTVQHEPTFQPAYEEWKTVIHELESKLPADHKNDKPRKRNLAAAYKNWGDLMAKNGDMDEANAHYCQAAQWDVKFKGLCSESVAENTHLR